MSDHQIRIEARKTLQDGKVSQVFTLTEWDEAGEYGSISMSEPCARQVGKILRDLSAPDPRLWRHFLHVFIQNPVSAIFFTIKGAITGLWKALR